ncbi:uncharacterized protein PHALS_02922 [Plasmopara halstedii]|uniref:Uncharacterized protein n=1 Tax=Plasmopara halstedii TaxID=4781 RepID=A0A0P1AYW4_PLAHL|nr:uncharacterized protein PHALS_02922 [Plasmopara halstedii]CEG46522.1 hypothetical protein PHALS_02922 [Plasmopara halstedii]|eukprot:XP_024582891.1 hypothetical protein PHALS_02922 [Plasmopara halstedii]
MKRNFGSLNLAALGANSAECNLADRFSAMDPSAESFSMVTSGSDCSSDENVGLSLERLDQPRNNFHSARRIEDLDLSDAIPEITLNSPDRSFTQPISQPSVSQKTHLKHSSVKDSPQHLHDVELNAMRCISLKMMLSNLSSPTSSDNLPVSPTNPSYSYSGVNEHTKTALLPARHPSLQSV